MKSKKELEAEIKELEEVVQELTDENERLEVLLVDVIVSDIAKQDAEWNESGEVSR